MPAAQVTRGADEPPYRKALNRAIYLLDRDLAPTQKIRAFGKGRMILDQLGATEVDRRVRTNSLIKLEGIGQSINAVVCGTYGYGPTTYIDQLEATTGIPLGAGAGLRGRLQGDSHSHST